MSVDTLAAPDLERLLDGDDERTCEAEWADTPCARPAVWVAVFARECGHWRVSALLCDLCLVRITIQGLICTYDDATAWIVRTEPLR